MNEFSKKSIVSKIKLQDLTSLIWLPVGLGIDLSDSGTSVHLAFSGGSLQLTLSQPACLFSRVTSSWSPVPGNVVRTGEHKRKITLRTRNSFAIVDKISEQ